MLDAFNPRKMDSDFLHCSVPLMTYNVVVAAMIMNLVTWGRNELQKQHYIHTTTSTIRLAIRRATI